MKAAILRAVLCSAQASSVLLVDWAQPGNEAALYSTVQDIDGCVCLEALLAPENVFAVCVFACGYSWALMTTLGNSSWHQLHSIALLHQIASASMTKRSPLQIFQNHVVLTVPFLSRKAPPWSCIWPDRIAFGVLLKAKVSRLLL